jgi:hypothetical protein
MDKQLMEAHINSSGASKTEIANSFNEAYDVIRQIAKKYNNLGTNGGTIVDQVTYVVSFVHPEIKSLSKMSGDDGASGYRNTPSSIFDNYAVEIPVDTSNSGMITENKLPFLNQPMVSLLNAVTSGVLSKLLNAQPRGTYTDDDSSSFGVEEFERRTQDLQETILNNASYTTAGFIRSKIQISGDKDKADALSSLSNEINYDSLFGFNKSDVTHDPNGDDAWSVLETLEHWFYALISNNITIENKKGQQAEGLGESVFTYVKALRKLLTKPEVARVLQAIDERIMNPTVGDVEIADRGELRLNGDLFQLGVLMCMSANSTVADAQQTPLATYLLGMVDANQYADGIRELTEFINSPYLELDSEDENAQPEKVPLVPKVGTNSWKVPNLTALAQYNAQEHDNPAAARLAKQLGQKQPISASLAKLATSGVATKTIRDKYSIVTVIANMIAQYVPGDATENLESGLVADPATATDTIGLKETLTSEEKNRRANVNKPPMDLANDFINQAVPPHKMNLLTQDEMEVSILDPATDDVRGSVILPQWAIPMFSTEVKFEKGDDANEQLISNKATAIIAYMAIAYNGEQNIAQFPWFRRSEEEDEDILGNGEPQKYIAVSIDYDPNIDAVEIAKAIEQYFKWLVLESTDPSNVVRLRNGWVSALNDPDKWSRISGAVNNYLDWYIDEYLNVTSEESEEACNAVKQKLRDELEDTIIPGAKAFVNRNIFNVKERSRDVQLTNDLIAVSVKPISPINLSENGRLRESGGDEGTVTSDGKRLLNNTMGRVVKVVQGTTVDRKGGGSVPNNTYKVYFKQGSGLVTGEFTDSMLDTWMPNGLVVMVDSASKTTQYALWVGVNFVDLQTMEGNLGSFHTSPEEIGASNEAYMNSVVGSPSYVDSRPNAQQAASFLDTVSGPALGAVRRAGDIITKLGSRTFNQIYDMLRFAASPKVSPDEAFTNSIQMSEIGKKSAEKAASDIFAGVASVFAATKMDIEGEGFYCDIDSTHTLHELLSLCGPSVYRKYAKPCLQRLSSALLSLTDIPEVADHPFVIESIEGSNITIGNNGEDLSHTSQFEAKGNGEAFTGLINDLSNDARAIEAALHSDSEDLDALYETTIGHLEDLTSLFDDEFKDSFAASSNIRALGKTQADAERTIAQYAPLLTNQEAYGVLATIISETIPELRQSPEVMNKSILDVFNATYYARQLPGDLANSREPHNDYDSRAGQASQKLFTGSEGYEDEVTPDYTGERDDFSGSMLSNSLDHEGLENFDADDESRSTYEGISSDFPMLNMIKCDKRGMYSGNGNFNVSTGISPPELEQVAGALDSAHETVMKVDTYPGGKNAAIGLYVSSKNYSLDKMINAFYGFMTSKKTLAQRNIIADVSDVRNNLESVASEGGDITVKPMIDKVFEAFSKVASNIFSHVKGELAKRDVNLGRLEELVARQVSTTIANCVLYLNSAIETEMPTADPSGLEVYGKRNRGGYEINTDIADKFATASAINPDANRTQTSNELGKRVLAVTKTQMTKDIRGAFRDSMDYGVNEVDRFADTLTNIYERIGKSATLGYENAISPFDDLVGKSQAKHDKPYKTLYTGESMNDLGATIMFAIISDERTRNPGTTTKYGMLENIIRMLTGDVADNEHRGQQTPISVPKYIIKGLYTVEGDDGGKTLDYSTLVWAMFRPDGSSVISDSPNGDFAEQPPAFAGLGAIGKAINVPLTDDDTIDEAVSKIRTAIIERKLDNNTALDTLARKDSETNKKIYSETISNFVDTMLAAASVTMETPTTFVPLSVLYTCLDDKALNTAMHNVIEKASTTIRQQQHENSASEIMRSMVGGQYGDIPEVGEIAEENEAYLVKDFANALRVMKSGVGSKQAKMRTAINYHNSNEIDGEEVPIPESSLREIFGRQKAEECVSLLLQQVPLHVLASMDDRDLEDHARSFVRAMKEKNNIVDASAPLVRIADDLFGIADGATSVDDGLKDITTTIGARNSALALQLAKEYFKNLGTDMPTGDDGVDARAGISPSRMRNIALKTVNRALNTKGEFRSLFLNKYPTEANTELQARKIMHGKVHPFGTTSIGDVNGLSVMYEKVKNALNGTMDSDDAAELLSGVFFNIDGVTGSAAITAFNKYFKVLKEKLASVLRSTNAGVTAQLKLNAGDTDRSAEYTEKVNANKCAGVNALKLSDSSDPANAAGPARELAMKKLEEAKRLIIDAIGKDSTNSVSAFETALRTFMEDRCVWWPDMSNEELTAIKNASKTLGNKELDEAYVTLRDGVAAAFASSNDRYQRDVKSIVGMSSSATGINVDLVIPPSKLKSLADAMATFKDSPIKHTDSDMYDAEYEIDGKPMPWNRCMVILNAALSMCHEAGSVDKNVNVRELINEDLFQCVRRCASSVRDLPLQPDSIASILLTTMFKKNFITLSPIDKCVRLKHRFDGGWFTFDIPVAMIYNIVEDKISHADLSKSMNEWKAFADEIDRFTSAGNRLNSYQITNHELGNQLWDLFVSVKDTVIGQIDSYLNNLDEDAFAELCRSRNGMDTDDGIHITKSRVDAGDNNQEPEDSANAFPERRRGRNNTMEDRSQDIEFPERFPRDTRPFREPEEPDEPIAPEQETPAEPAGPAPEPPEDEEEDEVP